MATKKLKPTTAGRRDAVVDDFSDITTADPYKPLLAPLTKKGGRNNKGRITVRHRGGKVLWGKAERAQKYFHQK